MIVLLVVVAALGYIAGFATAVVIVKVEARRERPGFIR